jgi:hypothetical protein
MQKALSMHLGIYIWLFLFLGFQLSKILNGILKEFLLSFTSLNFKGLQVTIALFIKLIRINCLKDYWKSTLTRTFTVGKIS